MVKRILHITESLNRGGAEVLLVGYIKALPSNIENIVVYLGEPTNMLDELENVKEIFCLNYYNKRDLPRASSLLRRIIKNQSIDLVHSHLYWPTIISRFALPRKVSLVFSVHSLMTNDAFGPNILSKYLEKLTYTKNQTAVFVSDAAYSDYKRHIKKLGRTEVIYNFVEDKFFVESAKKLRFNDAGLRLVSVGNLRPQKGHFFLIKCLQSLKEYDIKLDVYGEGHQRQALEKYIKVNNIENVRLMGSSSQLDHILKEYDAFVLASQYEGFCIAMVEAMAVGLPCIVPKMEALNEVSSQSQLYFDLESEKEFIEKVLLLNTNRNLLVQQSIAAKKVAERYSKAKHVARLVHLYNEILGQNQ